MQIIDTKQEDVPTKSWLSFLKLVDGQLTPEVIGDYLVTTSSVFPRITLGASREAIKAAKLLEDYYEFGGDDDGNRAIQDFSINYEDDVVSKVEYRVCFYAINKDSEFHNRRGQATFDALKKRLTELLGKPRGKAKRLSWQQASVQFELTTNSTHTGGRPIREATLIMSRASP